MALLGEKKIRRRYMHRYKTIITPDYPLDENGFEIPSKEMKYFIVLDQNNYAYLIPSVYDKEQANWVKAYEPEDIVDAAAGDKEKQNKINEIHSRFRENFHNDSLFSEDWVKEYYEGTKEVFLGQYNNRLQERGFQPVTIDDLPQKATTVENITPEQIKIINDNAVVPPPPVQDGGQDRF